MTTVRPLLMTPEMSIATREGRKTQTRWVLKPQPVSGFHMEFYALHDGVAIFRNPHTGYRQDIRIPWQPGDIAYVREAWRPERGYSQWDLIISYPADDAGRYLQDGEFDPGDWQFPKAAKRGNVPSIHMPRWASRTCMVITDVRVERLADITNDDAKAEGVTGTEWGGGMDYGGPANYRPPFIEMWNTIHAKHPEHQWEANLWVVVLVWQSAILKNVDNYLREVA